MAHETTIGSLVASFNLFLEADGKLWLTISGGSPTLIKSQAVVHSLTTEGKVPADLAIELVSKTENFNG